MKKIIVALLLIILGVILYDTFRTPDYVKVNQEMTMLCTMSGNVECD